MLSLAERTSHPPDSTFQLPESVPLRMDLGDAIRQRRSHRLYTGDPLPLDYLATVVRCAVGYTGQAEVDLASGAQVTLNFRATPSGGRLLPVQLYIAVLNVTRLQKGLYSYDPLNDCLHQVGARPVVDKLLSAFATSEELLSVSRASALLLLTAKPWRTMRKYGPRGMRLVFMEAGYIAQNIHLAATALGFGTVDCASIYDDEADEALSLDGTFETLVHAVVIGCK
jgi:SagB-type dehydrogenase family enzyme